MVENGAEDWRRRRLEEGAEAEPSNDRAAQNLTTLLVNLRERLNEAHASESA